MYVCMYIYIYIYIYTHIHTYIHTYIHTVRMASPCSGPPSLQYRSMIYALRTRDAGPRVHREHARQRATTSTHPFPTVGKHVFLWLWLTTTARPRTLSNQQRGCTRPQCGPRALHQGTQWPTPPSRIAPPLQAVVWKTGLPFLPPSGQRCLVPVLTW